MICWIYIQYHKELSKAVELVKEENKEPFIIDCHSFNEQPFYFDSIKDIKFRKVDFCFGYNHREDIPKKVFNKIKKWATDYNFSYDFNMPYDGSITSDNCTKSLMIEVNKRIYLEKDNITPKDIMSGVKFAISELLNKIKED